MLFEITQQLEKDIIRSKGPAGKRLKSFSPSDVPPVLQLNYIPAGIDVSQYKNPFGPTNPQGSYINLYRFRELTNNISQFVRYYSPSGKKIDKVYENIITGATVKETTAYVSNALFQSRQTLQNSRLSNLDGIPDTWYPVYATPEDWFDKITYKDKLFLTEIDFTNPADAFSNQFTVLDNRINQNLDWTRVTVDRPVLERPLDKGSSVKKIKFKFMQVQMNRPWINLDLFEMNGWYLEGQDPGYISTGTAGQNSGVFPLYPTSFLLATDLEITGDFEAADLLFVSERIKKDGSVNLGPFNINSFDSDKPENSSIMKNDGFFIVAWISQLIDFSPKINH
ncbi:MAG: hypothetical protein LBQ74_02795 [Prevotella sp.]|jgi:hypothetical protein|nr:hypothetical protein [Prevotella sp.]